MRTYTKIDSTEYLTSDCLSGGDYGGLGYIAHVNVKELENMAATDPEVRQHIARCGMNSWSLRDCVDEHNSVGFPPALIISEGGYNSITAYVHPEWPEGVEAVEALEHYPVLDDEALSERECELESESWSSYIRDDLQKMILDGIPEAARRDQIELLLDDDELDLREHFQAACELHNVYPAFEGGGSVFYHGMDDIAATIRDYLLIETDDSPAASAFRAARDGLMGKLPLEVCLECGSEVFEGHLNGCGKRIIGCPTVVPTDCREMN
jgi:hypothetical protein